MFGLYLLDLFLSDGLLTLLECLCFIGCGMLTVSVCGVTCIICCGICVL